MLSPTTKDGIQFPRLSSRLLSLLHLSGHGVDSYFSSVRDCSIKSISFLCSHIYKFYLPVIFDKSQRSPSYSQNFHFTLIWIFISYASWFELIVSSMLFILFSLFLYFFLQVTSACHQSILIHLLFMIAHIGSFFYNYWFLQSTPAPFRNSLCYVLSKQQKPAKHNMYLPAFMCINFSEYAVSVLAEFTG